MVSMEAEVSLKKRPATSPMKAAEPNWMKGGLKLGCVSQIDGRDVLMFNSISVQVQYVRICIVAVVR